MGFQFRSGLAGLFALTAQAALELTAAQDAQLPRLYTNEIAIEDATRRTALGIDDPVATFAFIFGALPDRVRVYPTENYFYFSFFHNGTRYAGNIRLAAADRDNGKLHFEYYQDVVEWMGEGRAHHAVLDASQGVTVERVERLIYRVSRESRSVIFALEDLSGVKPPANALGPHEEFIGPVADESAIRFFLVYNWRLKIFHYVLDETSAVADELVRAKGTDRILIGRRTSFAFYRDHRLDRRILIGVYEGNSRRNTYFDGPFDQLPENFIEGEKLRHAIVDSDPHVKGEIDRFGNFLDGSGRYLIHPYILYRTQDDLYAVHKCAAGKRNTAIYYKCLASNTDGRGGLKGYPIPNKKAAARDNGMRLRRRAGHQP